MGDYCNDGEHGGGKAILDLLLEDGYKDCAIFVVRNYGGVKLGIKRFDILKQAAKYALQQGNFPETENFPRPKQGKGSAQAMAMAEITQTLRIPKMRPKMDHAGGTPLPVCPTHLGDWRIIW